MAVSKLIGLQRQARKAGWCKNFTANDDAALLQGCYFDERKANKPISFIESFCRLSDGARAGQRITLLEWQADAITSIFGWQRANDTRRYRDVYITMAKKNAKSLFSACISVYCLEADGEEGAYVYLTAVDSEQTDEVFHPAAEMIRRSPNLSKRYKVSASINTITHGSNAWIKTIASDAGSSEGKNAHLLVIDELHAWKNQEFYDSLEYASIARLQPIRLVITTRGSDPNGICGAHEDHFLKIRNDEIIDISRLPIIYAPDKNDDLDLVSTWEKANPALGVILSVEDFASAYRKARAGTPAQWANFVRRRLNLWKHGDSPYFDLVRWNALAKPRTQEELEDCLCWASLDLSFKDDFTSIGLCFLLEDGTYHLITKHFIPEERIKEAEAKGESLYRTWKREGHLIACKGHVIRVSDVLAELVELASIYKLKEQPVAFDRWGAQVLMTDLEDLDFEVFQFGQGFKSMNLPTKELSEAILSGRVTHDDNPVMNWMMGNAVAQEDQAGNVKLVKSSGTGKKKQKYKIDGCICAVMSIDGAMRHRGEAFGDSDTADIVVHI